MDGNTWRDIFVDDRKTKKTRRVGIPSGGGIPDSRSFEPSISADARFVAFASYARNIIPNDGNSSPDAFVRGPLH